ncbi:hypothetical protein BDB00DRAFT_871820 [Zychaea mexicana]|uniref:uncharacterized protein n=1 Tax=Zychaea mexicana TaxID=64656 RepID=UPI0022FF0E29|nr:uncharacterized protein BDB00DRAFT_871820 [Zychaea mexicana]KAI9494066.1 hypothetical protein BDB00DRAFT_871820 [Zychaea mexicana]
MLDILRHMINSIGQYMERDSELTAYRHFAKLLDYLFRETNQMFLNIRKIDAIIATEVKKERVELSINEWEKSNVSSAIAFKQQSKSLRLNLSILNQLERNLHSETKNAFWQ